MALLKFTAHVWNRLATFSRSFPPFHRYQLSVGSHTGIIFYNIIMASESVRPSEEIKHHDVRYNKAF